MPALSVDNRFGLAYEAALLLVKTIVACSGYRAKGQGAQQTMFAGLELAMGASIANDVAYFDACRRKRNTLSYDAAGIVAETEAVGLLERARQFRQTVEAWITKHHSGLSRATL